jgi:hypothetical protein
MKAGEEYERLLKLRENRSKPDQQEACLVSLNQSLDFLQKQWPHSIP